MNKTLAEVRVYLIAEWFAYAMSGIVLHDGHHASMMQGEKVMKMRWMWTTAATMMLSMSACAEMDDPQEQDSCPFGETRNPITGQCVTVNDGGEGDRDLGSMTPDQQAPVDMNTDPIDMGAPVDMSPMDMPQDMPQDMSPPPDMDEPDMMLPPQGMLYQGSDPIFMPGTLGVDTISLSSGMQGAPVPIRLWLPREVGTYPVVVFQHGFLLANTHYSDLFTHIASHGFVVVAPQMYIPGGLPIGKPSTDEETMSAELVLTWVKQNIRSVTGNKAASSSLALAGHSRGGKVVWKMMVNGAMGISALVGVDPVDGTGGPLGGEARVVGAGFSFSTPTLIIGAGRGAEAKPGLFSMACAPAGDNYERFYGAAMSPAVQLVGTDYGHLDMIDDSPVNCGAECTACVDGPSREPMRRATAGWIVAHLRGALQGVPGTASLLSDTASAPVGATHTAK